MNAIIEQPKTTKSIDLGTHFNLANFLKDECVRHAQLSLNEYKSQAEKEEDLSTEFSSCFDFEGLRVFYRCEVSIPCIEEYCKDVDDYLYVESEDVRVENLEIELIETITESA